MSVAIPFVAKEDHWTAEKVTWLSQFSADSYSLFEMMMECMGFALKLRAFVDAEHG